MKARIQIILPALLRSGLLVGATYWLSENVIPNAFGLRLIYLSIPLYIFAALLLVSELIRRFISRSWASAVALLLSRLGLAIMAFAVLRGLATLASDMAATTHYASIGQAFKPYSDLIAQLAPWTLAVILAAGAYRAAEPWLARLKEPISTKAPYIPGDLSEKLVNSSSLAGIAFLFLHSGGLLNIWADADLGYLEMPIYFFSAGGLLSDAVATFGRGLWRYAFAIAIKGSVWAYMTFVLLGGVKLFLGGLEPHGDFLGPYLLPLAPLAYWLTIHISLVTVYYATAIYWNRPRYPWIYARLGENPTAPVRGLHSSALLALATYLILNRDGLVTVSLKLHLDFLAPPFYILAGTLLASCWMNILGRTRWCSAISAAVFWGGFAQFAYFLLHSLGQLGAELANTPTYSQAGETALPYLVIIRKLDVWFVGILGLVAVYKSSSVYWKSDKYVAYHPMIAAMALFLLGSISWGTFISLKSIGHIYSGLGALIFSGFTGVSIGYLAKYTVGHRNVLVSRVSGWLAASRFRNANIGVFIALYVMFIRPALYSVFIYAPLLEMIGVMIICLYIVRRPWALLEAQQNEPPRESGWISWSRHEQVVSEVPDSAFNKATGLQKDFLFWSSQSPLLAHVVATLCENSVPLEDIARTVAPIVHYTQSPRRPPWLFFLALLPGNKRRREKREVLIRQRIHAQVVASLRELKPALISFQSNGRKLDEAWKWAEHSFVQQEDKAKLVTVVVVATWQGGVSLLRVNELVVSIVDYQDIPTRWYNLPRTRRRIAEENRNRRCDFFTRLQSKTTSSMNVYTTA